MTLINGDCTLVADQIADNSIDFLLTDPPYNISNDGAKPDWIDPKTGENKNTIHSQKFDENFDSNWDSVTHDEFIKQMESWSKVWFSKLRKGGAFAVFISDQYISYLWKIMKDAGFEPKRIFTWKKPAAVPFNRNVNPVSGCEYVLWGIKPGGQRIFNSSAVEGTMVERYARADKISSIVYRMIKDNTDKTLETVFADALKESKKMLDRQKRDAEIVHCVVPNTVTYSGGSTKNKIHPTQKPVELLRYFIELCTHPGDTVLDTFAGSGSTGIACKETDRKYTLIERDKKMFDLMSKKFNSTLFE
jgi:site-specific DNA-methyltransferase (adenine-specific)|tara:strand:- start:3 stop:914 length:912 start_codon:yes stop_codon:yes gene_type:complete